MAMNEWANTYRSRGWIIDLDNKNIASVHYKQPNKLQIEFD